MAVTISSVKARQIFDSRGNPTVEVQFYLAASFLDSVISRLFRFAASFFFLSERGLNCVPCVALERRWISASATGASRGEPCRAARPPVRVAIPRDSRCSVLCFRSVVIRFSAKLWVLLSWALSPCLGKSQSLKIAGPVTAPEHCWLD
jgi:hypothetical protein